MPVARIHPVIVVAPDNPKAVKGLDDLKRADVRVVLANPELASIGKTTRDVLQQAGMWGALSQSSHVSFVGTVNEVAQAIIIKAADSGIICDSLAMQFDLQVIEVDVLAQAQRWITVGVLTPNNKRTQSINFARYLTARDRGLLAFAKYRFIPIEHAADWVDVPQDTLSGAP